MTRRIESPPGIPGLEGSIAGTRITLLNASNELPQKNQVAIGTVTPEIDYTVIINNYSLTYRSSATDTATTISSNLAESINLAGLGVTVVSDPTTGDLELTGTSGIPYDIILSGGDAGFVVNPVQNAAKSSPIKFGRVVVSDPADDLRVGRLPTNSAQVVRGISMHVHKEQRYEGGACYEHGEEMCVKSVGSIWVQFEGLVDKTAPIYYRADSVGSFTELGALTSTSDAGTTLLQNARFLHIQGNLAEVLIDVLSPPMN